MVYINPPIISRITAKQAATGDWQAKLKRLFERAGLTERHYAPWVRARQEQAEADVRRAWGQDPVALLEGKGTPEVHETASVVN